MVIIPTIDEIIQFAMIRPQRTKNIYIFGSRVYGTHREDSDWDIMVVGSSLLAKEEKRYESYNIHIHTTDIFKDDLFRHDVHAIECYFAPDWAKLQIKEPFDSFKLNPNKIKQSFLAESFSSWQGAKMKINDGNVFKGIKSAWHSLRILMFGIQIVEHGKITNWSEANDLWFNNMKNSEDYEWYTFKKKYFDYKRELENKLKGYTV